jgi:uncharacterized protein (TIGR03435 family)
MVLAVPLVCAVAMRLSAQTPVQPPAEGLRFEVASVKPNDDVDLRTSYSVRPDALILTGVPLRQIISLAYDMGLSAPDWKLVSGSPTLMASRFTITAKTRRPASPAEVKVMLRSLLAERFGLQVHAETRQGPVFVLMRLHDDRLGKDLRPSQAPACKPTPLSLELLGNLTAQALSARCPSTSKMEPSGVINKIESGTMAVLIESLASIVISRPIVDATGLQGMYEWRLRYQMLAPLDPDAQQEAPSVLDAVPEQLGLKLEPRTGPVEVLVVDSLKRPDPD